jgi:hypothetical protein
LGNYNSRSLNTPDEDEFHILFSRKMREAVSAQLQDNDAALYARLQALGIQVIGQTIDEKDLLALLYEDPRIRMEYITDNFIIDEEQLAEIRAAEPISIASCLECRDHLSDGERLILLRQLRALRYLDHFEAGERVKLKKIEVLLCGVCSREHRHLCEEQLRAERLTRQARIAELRAMPLSEYLLTREWRAKKNRKIIQAGNRCQLCGRNDRPLNVHHNTYERLGDDLLEDLMVLCRGCHDRHHGILPEAAS